MSGLMGRPRTSNPRKHRVTVTLEEPLRDRLIDLAKQQQRSMSDCMRLLLLEYMNEGKEEEDNYVGEAPEEINQSF